MFHCMENLEPYKRVFKTKLLMCVFIKPQVWAGKQLVYNNNNSTLESVSIYLWVQVKRILFADS